MPGVGVIPSRYASIEGDAETLSDDFQWKESLRKPMIFAPDFIIDKYLFILIPNLTKRFPLSWKILPEQPRGSPFKHVPCCNSLFRGLWDDLPVHRRLLNGLKT